MTLSVFPTDDGNPPSDSQSRSCWATVIAWLGLLREDLTGLDERVIGVLNNGSDPTQLAPFGDGTNEVGNADFSGAYMFGNKVKTKEIATTTYTLLETDLGKRLRFISSEPITLTLPANLPEGWFCVVTQSSTGQITIATAEGATYGNVSSHFKTAGRFAYITLIVDYNEDDVSAQWDCSGSTAA